MRLSVRLSTETLQGINKLKQIDTVREKFDGLRITNGNIVNHIFQNVFKEDDINWVEIINSTPIYFEDNISTDEIKTNLTVSDEVVKQIDELKEILPQYTGTSYVTVPFVIRIVVRAYLLQNNIK